MTAVGGLVQAMEADHIQTALVIEFGRVGEDACEQVVDLVGLYFVVVVFFGVVKIGDRGDAVVFSFPCMGSC